MEKKASAENRRRVLRRMSRTACSAESFFAMDSFSFRSPEPSLGSETESVKTRLTTYSHETQLG